MQVAGVTLWGELVGAIAQDSETHISTFEYAPKWISKGLEISPIHLPLGHKKYQFTHLSSSTFQGLPGLFADSLMDGFGLTMMDRWLTSQGRSVQSCRSLELLRMIGKFGKGAIEFTPEHPLYSEPPAFQSIEKLAESACLISGRTMDLTEGVADALDSLIQGSYTLTGMQPKAYISIHTESGVMLPAQAQPSSQYDKYLVKFGEAGDPAQAIQVEYAYNLMAQACGIDTCTAEILSYAGANHLLLDRFDRHDEHKLHFQTFCGIAHADPLSPEPASYQQLFATMRQLRLDRSAAEQMIRRMVFNVIACNHNDHTKSVGFLMSPTGHWRLAPAYGITYSNGMGRLEDHQMSINEKTSRLTREDLLSVVPSLAETTHHIIDEISERVSAWPLFARQAGIEREVMTTIQRDHLLNL